MNHTLHRAICTMLLLILGWHVYAKPIEGTVSDAAGNPIIGATVVEVSTSNGTVTDIDGLFLIDVQEGKKLQISYVGYTTQTITVESGKSSYSITLVEDTELLDDVVVIGYGTQRRSDVTGSISSVSAKDIADFSSKSLAESLQLNMSRVLQPQPYYMVYLQLLD